MFSTTEMLQYLLSSISKAPHQVIVDHADRLHEGIAYGSAHEREAPLLQVFAHSVRLYCAARYLLVRFPGVPLRITRDEFPDVGVKAAEFLLDFEKRLGVLNH